MNFLGGTGTVTGSKYVIEAEGRKLMVDCGLFQGLKQLRLRNWAPLPLHPRDIDTVLLTHAHLDHSGYLPVLVREGYRGNIYCTRATCDLLEILLLDSARLQEEEADYANRHGFSKHHPALALYTVEDAEHALSRLRPVDRETDISLGAGVHARWSCAGHMLGASSVRITTAQRSILFSGDLGPKDDAVLRTPDAPQSADYIVVESTYGDRLHADVNAQEALAEVLRRTFNRGGIVVIPSFAVGRAQTLMYLIHRAKEASAIPNVPVYLDSPMAVDATVVFRMHSGEHKLGSEEVESMCGGVHVVKTPDESRWLDSRHMPMVIIAGSGMATGGRVVHHIKAFAGDPRNTILFAGFQAAGTRGASMVGGAQSVKIHGSYVPIRAEVANLDMLSAHADREGLIDWLAAAPKKPRAVYVTHGEPVAADALRLAIEERLGWNCMVPDYKEVVELA